LVLQALNWHPLEPGAGPRQLDEYFCFDFVAGCRELDMP
jgi:hypothetical protein